MNYQRVIKPYYPAFKLRKLPKFTSVISHYERPFGKRLIPPINPDGSYPKWFTPLRPTLLSGSGRNSPRQNLRFSGL